jgi:hypothetical protein
MSARANEISVSECSWAADGGAPLVAVVERGQKLRQRRRAKLFVFVVAQFKLIQPQFEFQFGQSEFGFECWRKQPFEFSPLVVN